MTNIYGVPEEVGGYLPQEEIRAECPFCKGHHTQFIEFEFTNIDDLTHENHFCWDCEIPFAVSYELAF